jgi:hypothetical protein
VTSPWTYSQNIIPGATYTFTLTSTISGCPSSPSKVKVSIKIPDQKITTPCYAKDNCHACKFYTNSKGKSVGMLITLPDGTSCGPNKEICLSGLCTPPSCNTIFGAGNWTPCKTGKASMTCCGPQETCYDTPGDLFGGSSGEGICCKPGQTPRPAESAMGLYYTCQNSQKSCADQLDATGKPMVACPGDIPIDYIKLAADYALGKPLVIDQTTGYVVCCVEGTPCLTIDTGKYVQSITIPVLKKTVSVTINHLISGACGKKDPTQPCDPVKEVDCGAGQWKVGGVEAHLCCRKHKLTPSCTDDPTQKPPVPRCTDECDNTPGTTLCRNGIMDEPALCCQNGYACVVQPNNQASRCEKVPPSVIKSVNKAARSSWAGK